MRMIACPEPGDPVIVDGEPGLLPSLSTEDGAIYDYDDDDWQLPTHRGLGVCFRWDPEVGAWTHPPLDDVDEEG